MKNFKDCELKGRVLSACLQQDRTSQELFEAIQHPVKHALHAELYQLRRRGYLSLTSSNPHTYTLTKKGRIHAADPYLSIKRKQESIQRRVLAILENDERFQEAVENEVKEHLSNIPSSSASLSSSQSANPHQENSQLIEQLKSKDDEITRLQFQVQEMCRQKTDIRQREASKQKSPEEQKQDHKRVQERKKLATEYASRQRLLDLDFFRQWGDMLPYRLKHMQLYRKGSVEIMSRANPEHRRGHTKRMLHRDEIIVASLYIKQYRKDGIIVAGQCMREDKLLRW